MDERRQYSPEVPSRQMPADFVPGGLGGQNDSAHAVNGPVATAAGEDSTKQLQHRRAATRNESPSKPEVSARISLTGRLGTEVMVRKTPKGQDLARFALAIPTEGAAARYETVLVFGDRVRAVQEFQKGDAVEVIGYLHEREVIGRDGKKKPRREVYATVVRSR